MQKELFEKGIDSQQFIELLGTNKAKFEALMAETQVEKSKKHSPVKYVAVIAEPWSGDVLYNLPPLLKIAEANLWQVRIFRRDAFPDLILPYRKDGLYHSIPVFIFLNENFQEVGNWVERPTAATKTIDEESLKLRRQLREEHKEAWRKETVDEICKLAQC